MNYEYQREGETGSPSDDLSVCSVLGGSAGVVVLDLILGGMPPEGISLIPPTGAEGSLCRKKGKHLLYLNE